MTAEEERLLLQRLASAVNLLTLHPAQRLLMLQWVKAYLQVLVSLSGLGQNLLPGTTEIDQFTDIRSWLAMI